LLHLIASFRSLRTIACTFSPQPKNALFSLIWSIIILINKNKNNFLLVFIGFSIYFCSIKYWTSWTTPVNFSVAVVLPWNCSFTRKKSQNCLMATANLILLLILPHTLISPNAEFHSLPSKFPVSSSPRCNRWNYLDQSCSVEYFP